MTVNDFMNEWREKWENGWKKQWEEDAINEAEKEGKIYDIDRLFWDGGKLFGQLIIQVLERTFTVSAVIVVMKLNLRPQ